MIVDALLAFSGSITGNTVTGQAVTGTGTVGATNVVDAGIARDIGEGKPMYGRFEVATAFAGAGTSVEMQIIGSASSNMSTPTVLGTTGAIPVASLTLGARFACQINPQLASKGFEFYSAQYLITGGTVTAGNVYGDIGDAVADGQKIYGSGFAVL